MAVIGIGLDVVEVPRARSMLDRLGERLLARTMTQGERDYIERMTDQAPAFAARLAAKEAVYKALQVLPGARPVGWREIEVVKLSDGRPEIALHGRAAALLRGSGIRVHLSISHSRDVAAAVAILEG